MLYGFGFNFEIFDFELINIFYNWKLLSRLCRQSIFFLILKYTFSRNVSLTESVCWLFGVDYHHKITETAIFLLPGIGMFFRRWIISDTQHISDCFELWRVVEEKRLCQKNCGLLKSRSLRCSTVITSPPRYQLERPIISRSENLILVGS